MKEALFFIDDMTCQACSSGIERALGRKSFCESIEVHLLSKKARISYDENQANLEDIFALIRKMGYEPYLDLQHKEQDSARNPPKKNPLSALNA
ncbi:heavy metal-associated domain-containing protein, partial [Helicobacter typhlonius]